MGTHLPTTKTANMIIYKDILTGDEIISDSYDLKEVDGAVYEVDCAMITLGAVEVNTGANASAEEAEEGVEDFKATENLHAEYSKEKSNLIAQAKTSAVILVAEAEA